jgi:hypothetical protein
MLCTKGSYLPYFLFVIKENMDELHAAHHVEHEDGYVILFLCMSKL